MYNRIGQSLFVVGRQLTRKLCKNTKKNAAGALYCASNKNSQITTNNLIFQRNYCDKSSNGAEKDAPLLLSPDEEASIRLKEYLASPENERLYKIIELELEVLRQNNERVPDILKPRHWFELIQLDTRSKRKRYLNFVWTVEKKKENRQAAKDEKRKLLNERPPCETPYRLGDNSMFLRIYETTMNHMYNGRLINAIQFGQPVVMDCSYESYMTRKEVKNCARQLKLSFATNRIHNDPFNMYFCNANVNGELMKALHRFIPPLYDVDFPLNVKTESYLDVFDRERLVYLTPHCQQEMKDFDPDAVYIIGAFIDKSSNEPVSLAKAKREGIKMAKLPLDRYLQWGCSSGKNLTLNAVLDILLDLRYTGSWTKALEHVPRRKLYEARENAKERQMQRIFRSEMPTGKAEENDEDEDEEERIIPLKLPGPKFTQRLNKNPQAFETPRSYNRPNYQQNSGTDYQNSSTTEQDFSLKGRAKLKKNWNN